MWDKMEVLQANFLSTFTTNAASKLDVLGHDGHTLGVDRAQVGVLKEADQVSLRRFLQSHNGRRLEAEIGLEVLCDLTDETLEGQLADQELRAFLVATDLSQSDSSRSVAVRFLDSASGRRAFTRSLGRQLFARGFSTGGFTGSLLCTSHCSVKVRNCGV